MKYVTELFNYKMYSNGILTFFLQTDGCLAVITIVIVIILISKLFFN